MRKLGAWLTILALVSGVACSRKSPAARADSTERIPVSVVKPQRRTIADRLALTGSITPYEQVTVYAKVSGYLKSLAVDMGDGVRQGQLLAEIDVPEMMAALEEKRAALLKAQAAVEQARASVEQSRAALEFQEVSYKRLQAIHDKDPDVMPRQEVDQARSGFAAARAKVKTDEAQVKVAEAAVAAARTEIETLNTLAQYARIVAPLSGVVSQRFVDPGALVQAASTSRTQAAPIVSIARLDKLRVVADVPEPSVRFVKAGSPATLQVYPGESFPARVARAGTVLDPASRTMRIELDVANPGQRLRPGMTVKVLLELQKIDNALTVPVAAIRAQGLNRVVFVVEGETAKQRVVKTGLEFPEWIQVVEGLKGEEEVVVATAGTLADGASVRVNR